ncbi:helix-turn-helix domain-containing protein [Paenibacillus protaetiae]|uniref:AraC family transcriptional regulator n=1 Tax=Paenibacillus protaetiae TaxID=2509456 RepID=A0A4P6EZ29_9BACL|nr:helix-turn-helix domain-containing protein [Paenibacillus protaetiae]QAY65957.1 AraC family transcriptional regulator [Paenibacillus protaetiae]
MRKPCFMLDDDAVRLWMRDRFMRDLLANTIDPKLNLKDVLTDLQLNPYFTFPAVALFEPRKLANSDHEKMLYMEQAREFLQKQIQDGSFAFLDEDGRAGLLFSWDSREVLEHLRGLLSGRFGCSFHIGVGKPCSHLYDVHQSYGQALEALRGKFYNGGASILYYAEQTRMEKIEVYPAAKEKELYDAFRSAVSPADIKEAVNVFYEEVLEGKRIDVPCIYELTIRTLVALENRVLEEERHVPAYAPLEIMEIVKHDTLEDMQDYVCRFLCGLWEVTSPNQKETHRSIIKKTMHYMEQECQYASLQSVAEKVYMTPTYLSLLFKTNTGKTFIEHLTDIRIDKAKDMLRSTHYKNYEVAEKVGYHDSRYFSQIFKRKVGVSPSEYRELICK